MPDRQSGRSSGVEHNLAKVGVEGSNPFARSRIHRYINGFWGTWGNFSNSCNARYAHAMKAHYAPNLFGGSTRMADPT